MFDLAARQRDAGDEVEFFGMAHDENEPMPLRAVVPAADRPGAAAGRPRREARRRRPHRVVAHRRRRDGAACWTTSAPTSSTCTTSTTSSRRRSCARCAARGIPAVMTLHDYKLACPTYRFLDHGEICERCLPHRFWEPILRRCNGGSLAASAVSALELSAAHADRRVRAGPPVRLPQPVPAQRRCGRARCSPTGSADLPNFVDAAAMAPKEAPGGGVVYAGRLSEEKGVDTLVDAVVGDARARASTWPATGPSATTLEALRAAPARRPHPVPRPAARRRGPRAAPRRGRRRGAVALVREHAARRARGLRRGVPVVGERARRRPRADRARRGRRRSSRPTTPARSPRRCGRSSRTPTGRSRWAARRGEGGVARSTPRRAPRAVDARSTPRRARS